MNSNGRYVLIGQTPVEEPDLLTWAQWFETSGKQRQVALTKLPWCAVSTIFLGLDHSFCFGVRELHAGDHQPILFESMAFWPNGDTGDYQERCSTWLEAEAMHAAMVAEVSQPKAILGWLLHCARSVIRDASRDWRKKWADLQGVQPSDLDALLNSALDRLQEARDAT